MTDTAYDHDHDEEDYPQKGFVAPRYMGTIADKRDMSALGRVQVLRVSCSRSGIRLIGPELELTTRRGIFGLFRLLDLDAR